MPETLADFSAKWRRDFALRKPAEEGQEDLLALLVNGQLKAYQQGRIRADLLAAWQRFHKQPLIAAYPQKQRHWYELLEYARLSVLAAQALDGIALNLKQNLKAHLCDAGHDLRIKLYCLAYAILAEEKAILQSLLHDAGALDKLAAWYLQQARSHLCDGAAYAQTLKPLIIALAAQADAHNRIIATDQALSLIHLHNDKPDAAALRSRGTTVQRLMARTRKDAPDSQPGYCSDTQQKAYRIYSTDYDKQYHAAQMITADDVRQYQLLLASVHDSIKNAIKALAHQLQRRLLAAQKITWEFNQTEGKINPASLSQFIARPDNRAIFRRERHARAPASIVTILIDQSASMSGQRIQMCALSTEIMVQALQRCNIKFEVLGFSTRYAQASPLLEHWQQHGSVGEPGRLNALLHIIYKQANEPWKNMRHNMGLMLRPSLQKENVDGEALLWAARRLLSYKEPRRILVVLSDGRPKDRATEQANGSLYLDNHLRQVIADIEKSPIELAAIGIAHEVSSYYQNAITIHHPDNIAKVLCQSLAELLS